MDTNKSCRFAITARCLGFPRKLYTPVTVANPCNKKAARVNAMWDTGAETCVMSEALADRLGFSFGKSIEARGLTGSSDAPVGYAYVSLLSGGGLVTVATAVVADPVGSDEYSFIIGLNLLRLGSFSLSHSALDTMLSFKVPSGSHTDYAAEAFHDVPSGYLPLSSGKEELNLAVGDDAIRLMADAVPDSILKNYLSDKK